MGTPGPGGQRREAEEAARARADGSGGPRGGEAGGGGSGRGRRDWGQHIRGGGGARETGKGASPARKGNGKKPRKTLFFFLRSGCGDRADGDSRRGCVPSRDKLFFVVRSTEST
jgi:hypothetical protein